MRRFLHLATVVHCLLQLALITACPLAWVGKMCGLLLPLAGAACCLLRLALMRARPLAWVDPTSGRGLRLVGCLLAQLGRASGPGLHLGRALWPGSGRGLHLVGCLLAQLGRASGPGLRLAAHMMARVDRACGMGRQLAERPLAWPCRAARPLLHLASAGWCPLWQDGLETAGASVRVRQFATDEHSLI